MHQEAIQLCFRQREGAFLLDRVLRGHHQEQRRQRIGVASHGDLAFAHRFQQRRLHLGRRTVDFIGQQDRVEDRAGHELEAAFLRAPDLGAGEVGRQQVRGELHAREVGFQPCCQRADRRGLGQPRRPLHQQVAVGQQRDQQALDQRGLAADVG
ncbi:hypothetical protein G6F40_014186 [Rhizopus arrhizus]|nr:hypothetical protein G6F40_014186 [Rhizopus arrhizus]